MRLAQLTLATVLAAFGCAGSAGAQVTVFGDSVASTCSKLAKAARMNDGAVDVCTTALTEAALSRHDEAATRVNRATMYLHRQDWATALVDLDAAIRIEPALGEARVNRGAVYIAQNQPARAVAEIDAGLALGSEEPEKGCTTAPWPTRCWTTCAQPISTTAARRSWRPNGPSRSSSSPGSM